MKRFDVSYIGPLTITTRITAENMMQAMREATRDLPKGDVDTVIVKEIVTDKLTAKLPFDYNDDAFSLGPLDFGERD